MASKEDIKKFIWLYEQRKKAKEYKKRNDVDGYFYGTIRKKNDKKHMKDKAFK